MQHVSSANETGFPANRTSYRFMNENTIRDLKKIHCPVTLRSLLSVHLPTLQDPLIGPADDVKLNGVAIPTIKKYCAATDGSVG